MLHLCFASFTKQNTSGKKNWKSSCEWNIIHFFFVQVYSEISRGGFMHAIAVISNLTNQISLLENEAKHKWLMFCFVLANMKKILRHFCFVGMRACAGGANEAKHKWNITHRNLPNNFGFFWKSYQKPYYDFPVNFQNNYCGYKWRRNTANQILGTSCVVQLLLDFVYISRLQLDRSIFSTPQNRHQHPSAAVASFACVWCLLCK